MGEVTYESQPAMQVTRFEWKIDTEGDAHKLVRRTTLNSREFILNENNMKVGLRFIYGTRTYNLSIQLVLTDLGSTEVRDIQCNFWIVDIDGKRTDLPSESKEISESQPIIAATSSSVHNTLYNIVFNYRASLIGCEIKHTKKEIQALPSNFRENLWNAYKNGLCDTCIIQVEGKEFKISKTILAAQSEVFKCMFSMDNTEESKTGIVKIQDISATVMEAVVQFLHLGAVENLDEIAEELFVAADKYAIHDLKVQCSNSIGASLSKENFSDRIVLAFKHNSDELKKHVLNFLSKSNDGIFMSLLASDEWLDFAADNKELAKEILSAVDEKLKIMY